MKTRFATPPSLPGLGITLVIAGIFAIPLLVWGDRWPWLVVLPVAIIVILTVRSEWLRIRALTEKKNVQVLQATFIPDAVIFDEMAAWDWSTHVSIPEQNWIITAPSDSRQISNIIAIDDYDTRRRVVDEKLTAVA
jgi:hypothetical protein